MALLISLAALLVRVLVSVGPYSGQGAAPKFGDYEAQRHWMELTLHLPPSDWYRDTSDNDLAYWGLDYPPLSAYQSLLHGRIINASLPDAVALRSSRGYESTESYVLRFNRLFNCSFHAESCVVKTCCCFGPTRKLLMRWTVLSSDLLVFFPAALWFVWAYVKGGIGISAEERREGWMWLLAMVLLSPCLLLIDHGHFQVSCSNDFSLRWTIGRLLRHRTVS